MPIVRRRSRGRSFGGRAQRAPSTWTRIVSTSLVTVAAATKQFLVVLSLNNVGIGETVRRTRGMFYVVSDQGSVPDETQVGAFGLIVASDIALGVGAASLPGPITEASDDGWFVWEPFAQSGSIEETLAPARVGNWYPFDSKAMRKIQEGYGAAVMIENASATDGLRVGFGLSLLSSIS